MKLTRTVLAAALVLLLVITSLACSLLTMPQTEELETKIYHFLKEKYPDLEFEIKGYTQDKMAVELNVSSQYVQSQNKKLIAFLQTHYDGHWEEEEST